MSLTFTILGCGSSAGVPRVGQGWGACDPNNPKNRRRRCSLFVERTGGNGAKTQVLVDMSPDLREQMLGLEIDRLDAILLTHSHADHIHGIDEIRPLVIMARRKIDLHMDAETAAIVRKNFSYIFETPPGSQYPALLNEHRIVTYHINNTKWPWRINRCHPVSARTWGNWVARFSLRRRRLYARPQRHSQGKHCLS